MRVSEDKLYQQIVPFKPRKGDMRKLDIIKATIECIATIGIENTNYETIGKICHMKRPHVLYYYPDRTELLLSAMKYMYAVCQEVVIEWLHDGKSRDERVELYIEGVFAWLDAYPHHRAALGLFVYLSSFQSQFTEISLEVKSMAIDRVFHLLNYPHHPDSKTELITRTLAENIHSYMSGEIIYWLSCYPSKSSKPFQKRSIDYAKSLLRSASLN